MTTEILTNYTESGDDANPSTGILQETSSRVSFASLAANAEVRLTYDFGASYFQTNFYAESTITVSSKTGTTGHWINFAEFTTTASTYPSTVNGVSARLYSAVGSAYNLGAWKTESSITTASDTAAASINLGTVYYTRTGLLSSLGIYGGVFSQVFSNSNRSTFVVGAVNPRTVATNYRYFNAVAGINVPGTDTTTGYVEDITLYRPSYTTENLTTFTETDPSSDLTVAADCIDISTMAANINAYVYKDGGAGFYVGNYILTGVVNVSATTAASKFGCLMLSNTVQNVNGTAALHAVIIEYNDTSTWRVKLREYSGAAYDSTTITAISTNAPLWLKVWRDTSVGTYGTLYLAAYSDPNRTIQYGSTVSLTLHENINFQYFMALASYNGALTNTISGTVGGVGYTPGINATKGAFSWAGKTSPLNAQAISAGVGAFSFAGKASILSQMIQATKGAFSWAGKTVNLNTGGQVNTSPGTFSWGGKSSPLSHIITATKGAFSWAGKTSLLGSMVTSLRTATLTKWDTVTEKEIPDTGLTGVLYMLYDPINLKVYDFSDNTFKASASCVTPQGTMTERVLLNSVGTNLTPGVYDILLATTGLSGLYQEYLFYYGTTNHLDSNLVRFQDGIEYLGGLTVAENLQIVTTTPAAIAAIPADAATAVWSKILPL